MSDATTGMTDAKAKRAFLLCILLSLVLGGIWGWCLYGLDFRTVNIIGLVLILVLSGYAGLVALSAWVASRNGNGD